MTGGIWLFWVFAVGGKSVLEGKDTADTDRQITTLFI